MKTKILILLLLFVTAFCLAFGVAGCDNKTPQGGGDDVGGESGESDKSGKLEFNEINDGELSGYSVSLGTVRVSPIVIPAVYNNLPVISIGEKAFYGYRGKSISIPESVTSVNSSAFDGCASLESITVDENNPSYASVDGILYNKDKTEFKHVPMAVKGPVRIPAGVVSVGGFAFYGRTSLESITIPENVTSIGIDAFFNCTSLKEINIGNGVISIGNNAFNNTAYYNASQNWTNDVLYIGEYLIQARQSIAGNCEIAAGTKLVADSAFFGCENLSSVTVGGKVEFIGNYAFRGCKNLKSVAFADSVKSVGTFAFYGCKKLEKVVAKDPEAWCNMGVSADYSNPLYYAHNLYMDDNLVTDFEIPQKVTEIKANAFAGCTSIESITIPDGVVSIGTGAFSGCSGLAEIAVPDSVTSIGFGAFENCTAAIKWGSNPAINKFYGSVFYGYGGTSIAIPKSVTSVENGAFDGCTNLESITVDQDNPAYSGSDGILLDKAMTEIVKVPQAKTSVTIPQGVAVIGENAFAGCTKLTEIALPDSVETVKNGAFDGCPRLESISVGTGNQNYASQNGILYNKAKTDFVYIPERVSGAVVIPDGITSIAAEAFNGCYGIESITIPDSVTSVGKDAFGGCTNIETATLPAHAIGFIPKDSLQTVILTSGKNLDDYAFDGCSNIKSITLHDGLVSIGKYAFRNCSAEIIWGENPTVATISDYAFSNYGGSSIKIPASVSSVGEKAFGGCNSLTRVDITDLAAWCKIAFESENAHPLYYTEQKHLYHRNDTPLTTLNTDAINGNVEIKNYAFYNCWDLTQIDDRKGKITSIGERSFAGCTHLETVNIGAITEIGQRAFSSCNSIRTVTIGSKITKIEAYAFLNAFKAAGQGVNPKVTINKATATVNGKKLTLTNVETNAKWLSDEYEYASYDWTF